MSRTLNLDGSLGVCNLRLCTLGGGLWGRWRGRESNRGAALLLEGILALGENMRRGIGGLELRELLRRDEYWSVCGCVLSICLCL
jgi:hypothetical protein